jgi:hypothetical protein
VKKKKKKKKKLTPSFNQGQTIIGGNYMVTEAALKAYNDVSADNFGMLESSLALQKPAHSSPPL